MLFAVEVHRLNRIVAVASHAIPMVLLRMIVFQAWKQEINRIRVYKLIGERLPLRVSVLVYDLFMRD